MERRLSAILAADVVGYGRLMERDEADTFERLRTHRKELFEPEIAKHHGRIFKLMGDGLLAEFGSVVEALECAVVLQRSMADRNADVALDRQIQVRIGINLGDVIVEGEDRHGEGVNIAARLQQLADPGGITVSRTVYNHVRNKLALGFESLGEVQVKNIVQPVAVYRVLVDGAPARGPVASWLPALRPLRSRTAGLAFLLLVAAAMMAAWQFLPAGTADDPRSPQPAIAVLPFDDFGEDGTTARLAGGITEDIITDLARFRGLDVIARNSTLAYKGKAVDVRQIARELDVGYVLEGSVQRRGDQLRITTQLIDATTGAHVWSHRWDRPAEDTFAVQTEIAEQVVATLGDLTGSAEITAAEVRKAKRRPPESLTAYDHYLLALEAKAQFTRDSVYFGLDEATKAIASDPGFARAYVARALLHYFSLSHGADFGAAVHAMEIDLKRAMALDPADAEARAVLGFYYSSRGRFAEGEANVRAALQANPNNTYVLVVAASTLPYCGHPDEAAVLADRALRLDPGMRPANLNAIKDAYFFARRFDDVIGVVSRLPRDAGSRGSRLLLTLSYALLDRRDEASRARDELLARYPSLSAELLLNQDWLFARPEEEGLLLEGFRAAGVPLCAAAADLVSIPEPRRLPECAPTTMK